MSPDVRVAEPSDRPTLEIIRRQAIEASFAPHYDRERYATDVATPDDSLEEVLASDRYACFLVETAATPMAYGAIARGKGRIRALYTAPEYAGRGHATRLLDVLGDAVSSEMRVCAPVPTVPFFESRGFEVTGEPTDDPVPRVPLRRRSTG